MRLIDADSLIDDLEYDVELDRRALDSTDTVGFERKNIQFDKDCKENFIWFLNNVPVVEARKIGKWIDIGTGQECSACGEIYGYDNFRKFCPNCGTDMRGEQRKGQWIERGGDEKIKSIECSECGSWFLDDHLIRSCFCPNCGADMGG